MTNVFAQLQQESTAQKEAIKPASPTDNNEEIKQTTTTPQPARKVTQPRDRSRETSREMTRKNTRTLPTRDEIQEFSFSLRDELKVKVQAEVPHHWQKELDDLARDLNVKKLELYRYIIGDFLGKAKRSRGDGQPEPEKPI